MRPDAIGQNRRALAIGTLRCFVIDVEDVDVGAAFWPEVTGIPPISSHWPDRFPYLGFEDETTWRHEIILHRVSTAKRRRGGRDLRPG